MENPARVPFPPSPPPAELPRERCLANGPRCLSLRECLALLIGTAPRPPGSRAGIAGSLGVAGEILARTGAGEGDRERAFFLAMEGASAESLIGVRGLGEAGRARILAAFELGRRYALFREQSRRKPGRPARGNVPSMALDRVGEDARGETREWIGFVPVHAAGGLGELTIVERGARTHVNLDPVELFGPLLALRPRAFFLFHNHPSGELNPSEQDLELTRRVRRVSEQLGVRFLGHGIVSPLGERWIVI